MRRSDLLLDRGIGRKALDCITMSAPLNASSLWLLGSGGGAGVRFVGDSSVPDMACSKASST
jgi:hypothetical protein